MHDEMRADEALQVPILIVGGSLLLGYYTVFTHPKVSYRCGFFGPSERVLLGQGYNVELVPGGFRQFAPILRRYAPRVMTASNSSLAASWRATRGSSKAPGAQAKMIRPGTNEQRRAA